MHPNALAAPLRCLLLTGMAVILGALAAAPSFAASIQYGDFGPAFPPGVTIYADVTESSGTDPVPPPILGSPTLTGDVLDFDPTGAVASATDGASDITDIQLNYDARILTANEVAGGMTSLLISESGDYSLFGSGTAATRIAGGLSVDIDILEVDGQAIDPISLFASASAVRDLVGDGPVVLAPWNNAVLVEFGPTLAANDIEFDFGVTKAEIAIDDQLIAISEPSSVAFIAKKDFTISPGIQPNPGFAVPEPGAALLLLGAGGVLAARRGRRSA